MQVIQGGAKRPKEAAEYLGCKLTKFWSLVRTDPDFPAPFKLGGCMTLFYTAELDVYLARKAQESQPQRSPRQKTERHQAVAHQG
ncbi:helix-turn-helix transcriptional regulator [Burkholderia pseudomallei]|uniref:helix-turn-helix transcriptional regulator n=1 Tax=Burkholderia pseudomallei TaxID=28450 RepID=UPI00052A1EF0|nr:hypothetical protein [Burkholderia pseudomallei]AIV65861.1 prophage CP4-57 regulatory domain protein [Burkholderia pseudomallei K42]